MPKVVTDPKPGDIILYQTAWADPLEWPVALFSPHFSHVAICTSSIFNRAVAANAFQGVSVQYARGEAVYVSMQTDWDNAAVLNWVDSQMGKPYDYWAWVRSAVGLKSPVPADRMDCSAFVGLAIQKFSHIPFAAYRETRPDDIARALGVL